MVTTKKSHKKKPAVDSGELLCPNITVSIEENDPFKKRGRKPKGGKLVSKNDSSSDDSIPAVNVILHLKCSAKDLDSYNTTMNRLVTNPLSYNPEVPPEIMAYKPELQTNFFSMYEQSQKEKISNYAYAEKSSPGDKDIHDKLCSKCGDLVEDTKEDDTDDVNIKDVNQKLKRLKINLYKNAIGDKKSACFWCTYEFDNQPCYIPKHETDGSIFGYGSFCRPECAVAFLMKENLDDSTKFERYHLLNKIYSKIYDFKKNIKPAPNPHYLLDKFLGTLSIQEYRKLLKTEHMLLVIDKPLTRILPELHEDTDDFITGVYGGTKGTATQAGGVYKVKRQSEKPQGPSKTSIMRDQFGVA
jgi:hypothetical protein